MTERIVHRIEMAVRFSEADPLGIVWHGHYIRYFEDSREDFGKKYGLAYLDVYKKGFVIPVVSVHCDYKRSLRYGDTVIIETVFIPQKAAKIRFEYTLTNAATGDLVATGYSVQVFLDKDKQQLQLTNPAFFEEWQAQVKQL